jgi:predicted nucleotide-binding protein
MPFELSRSPNADQYALQGPKHMPQDSSDQPSESRTYLVVSHEEASAKIDDRIAKGRKLIDGSYESRAGLEQSRNAYHRWSAYNTELLKTLFTNCDPSDEYSREFGFYVGRDSSFNEEIEDHHKDVKDKIHRLESIKERLELIPLVIKEERALRAETALASPRPSNNVFIVHGHDEAAREMTARYVEKLGLRAIILHEQANAGRTIIEKLEHYGDVDFAIVLLTPDDVGASEPESDALKARARQNVVLELGYFVGKLGRARVCALYKGDIDLPSDFLGVVYLSMDAPGRWRTLLALELKTAGFDIDLNSAT